MWTGEYLPRHDHPYQKSIAPDGHNEFLQGSDFSVAVAPLH